MSTAPDIDLTEALRDYAAEVGDPPPGLTADVLRGGQRLRRRRTAATLASAVAVLAAVALTVPTATARPQRPVVAPPTVTTTLTLRVTDQTDGVRQVMLRRLRDAGITVVGTTEPAPGQLAFTLRGAVSALQLTPLLEPEILEVRAVLDSYQTPMTAPTATDGVTGTPTLQQVRNKLGAAYPIAAGISRPDAVTATMMAQLAPFARLSPAEVSALPAAIRFNVPTITCAQLTDRPPTVTSGMEMVACDGTAPGSVKYLLDTATLTNADVQDVTLSSDGCCWYVTVALTRTGQPLWTTLTRHLYDEYESTGTYRQLAMVLDATVIQAPNIQGAITGPVIVGFVNLDQKTAATALAHTIGDGALPHGVSVVSIR